MVRLPPAEIGHLVTAVVNQEGDVMVSGQICPFTGGSECGEKQLAQVRGDGHRHQAGIGTVSASVPVRPAVVRCRVLENIIAFSGVVH